MSDSVIITCFLTKGRGLPLVEHLKTSMNINTANITSGRGLASGTPSDKSYGDWAEMDILEVLVSTQESDEVFKLLYEEGGIDRPHGGIIFMGELGYSSTFLLPDLNEE